MKEIGLLGKIRNCENAFSSLLLVRRFRGLLFRFLGAKPWNRALSLPVASPTPPDQLFLLSKSTHFLIVFEVYSKYVKIIFKYIFRSFFTIIWYIQQNRTYEFTLFWKLWKIGIFWHIICYICLNNPNIAWNIPKNILKYATLIKSRDYFDNS